VRIGGVVQPLLAARQPLGGGAADLPRPQAGVRVVETTLQQRPAPAPPPTQIPGTAPPPRGLSVRGQPTATGGAAPPPRAATPPPPAAAQPAGPPAGQPPVPAAPAAVPEKPESSGDDASARFSLLELD
jgi:hypothetical protein